MGRRLFNACEYLLDRRVAAGAGGRVALDGPAGLVTYAELHDRVCRTAAGLRAAGLRPEQRILMVMADSPDFVVVYLAAMRIGAIPVPVSTMLPADGIAELLRDSRARFLAVTHEFATVAAAAAAQAPELEATLSQRRLAELAAADPDESVYGTGEDSPAFWLYTSGTTGTPKAAMHRHASVRVVCETYGARTLGIGPGDRCLSSAKAFFAYGLGNSLLFPLSAGAASVLSAAPAKPDAIAGIAVKYGATLFFAGPTFFANMLRTGLPRDALRGVRLAVSAGEALPAPLQERWTSHFGVDIIDGLGMTEMLHIFLSAGAAVPGYELKLVDEDTGQEITARGAAGTLYVRGASAATGYWACYDASRQVFQGEWLRTGDTYIRDSNGNYACLGRTGDMIKSSGIWVSPMEVEARLLAHPAVAQAAVVAARDADGLEKPVAFVVAAAPVTATELIEFCAALPSFKRPRAVTFLDGFPSTATGKVRRVELRKMANA
jgi:benzoate-CoA ligase family protein